MIGAGAALSAGALAGSDGCAGLAGAAADGGAFLTGFFRCASAGGASTKLTVTIPHASRDAFISSLFVTQESTRPRT
jgi:hypothetical protein